MLDLLFALFSRGGEDGAAAMVAIAQALSSLDEKEVFNTPVTLRKRVRAYVTFRLMQNSLLSERPHTGFLSSWYHLAKRQVTMETIRAISQVCSWSMCATCLSHYISGAGSFLKPYCIAWSRRNKCIKR